MLKLRWLAVAMAILLVGFATPTQAADSTISVDSSFTPTANTMNSMSNAYLLASYDPAPSAVTNMDGSMLHLHQCLEWGPVVNGSQQCTKNRSGYCQSLADVSCSIAELQKSVKRPASVTFENPDKTSHIWSDSFLLDVCRASTQVDCVESVQAAQAAGPWHNLSVKYQPGKFPFIGDPSKGVPNGVGNTVWKFDDAAKAPFDLMLTVGGGVYFGKGEFHFSTFNISASATVDVAGDFRDVGPGAWRAGDRERCQPFGYLLDGHCGITYRMPSDLKLKVVVRFSHPLSGWLAGRLSEPSVDTTSKQGFYSITVQGKPIDVPQIKMNANPESFKGFHTSGACLSGCIFADNNLPGFMTMRDITATKDFEGDALDDLIRPATNDKAQTLDRIWRMTWNDISSGCTNPGSNIYGMLTTNSTFYNQNPPVFNRSSGTLDYKIAGLHYLPNGSVFEGVYDLAIQKATALCVFGLKDVPLSATVSVVGANGEVKVSVATMSEVKGWLHFHVDGFTFSSNQIKVKLMAKTTKPKTITCVKSSNKKITKKVTGLSPKCPSGYRLR